MKKKIFRQTISIILVLVFMLGFMPSGIISPPARAASKTLGSQDTLGEVALYSNPGYTASLPATGTAWGTGNYIVSGAGITTRTDVTVSGNVNVWIDTGATLTINASAVSNQSRSGGAATAAINGRVALTNSGSLTFSGPGTLIITGGRGGDGGGYAIAGGSSPAGSSGLAGANGGIGGNAIRNSGTLTFAEGMSGNVTITGGVGGDGGHGRGGGHNNRNTTATVMGGNGGTGGTGGAAINNTTGEIVFNQDNLNKALGHDGTYSTGNINIKGGLGGYGGNGGNAGTASVYITGTRPIAGGAAPQGGYYTDSVVRHPTQGGRSIGGTGGYGVEAGTVVFNSGVATIEGGNRQTGYGSSAGGTTYPGHPSQQTFTVRTQVNTPPPNTYFWNAPSNSYPTASSANTGLWGSPRAATSAVTVRNHGGTNYLFGGDSGSTASMSGGSVTREGSNTGSLYAGGSSGFGAGASTVSVQLSYLEGFGNFADQAKNFYVLNAGDTWRDATGRTHTSRGIQVTPAGGTTYYLNAKDVYVSPQGWLYINGISTTDIISFDVAVGATLEGQAGTYPKEVRLSDDGSGVYRFSGSMDPITANIVVTITVAEVTPVDFADDFTMEFSNADARALDKVVITMTYAGDEFEITIPLEGELDLVEYDTGDTVTVTKNPLIWDDDEDVWRDEDNNEVDESDYDTYNYDVDVPVMGEREEVTLRIGAGRDITVQKIPYEDTPGTAYSLTDVSGITIGSAVGSPIRSYRKSGSDTEWTVTITPDTLSTILSRYNAMSAVPDDDKIAISGDESAYAELIFKAMPEIPEDPGTVPPTPAIPAIGAYEVASLPVALEVEAEVETSVPVDGIVTARWADDTTYDGLYTNGHDSSFDVHWLIGLANFNNVTISTAPQFAAIAWAVNNGIPGAAEGTYALSSNIDLGSFIWTPIGTEDNPFTGTFNGGNFTITNMRINRAIASVEAYGLFGYTVGATIGNFTMTRNSFAHPSHRTVKLNTGVGVASSGGAYNNLTSNVVTVSRAGSVYAGAAVGHATNTNINNITALGLDVTAATTTVGATVAVGGIVGLAVNTKLNPAERLNYTGLTFTGGSFTTVEVVTIPVTPPTTINTGHIKATGGATAFAGGIAGSIENINISGVAADASTTNNAAVSADAAGTAWAGGLVGRAVNSRITGGSVNKTAANVTTAPAYLYNNLTASGGTGLAYAGGIVGQILGTTTTASEVSGNEVIHRVSDAAVVRATAGTGTGSTNHAYAGGILGHGVEAVAFNNQFLNPVNTALNSVEALAPSGSAWAGGHLGLIRNDGYFRVAIADTTITNVKVVAAGASEAANAAGEAFAGGLAGQIFSLRGAELVNINIHGVQPTIARATRDAHAARLAGFATRADIINTGFNNGTASTAAPVDVIGSSVNGDVYAAGVAGKIVINGSINASSVRYTNISATGTRSVWAGGIVGYAENTPISGSDVNRWMAGATESFITGTSTIAVAGTPTNVFAGGIGGEIINGTNDNDEKGKYHYIANSAVSVTKTLPGATARANVGGLYGKINNALIGISYARNYTINTNTGANATSNSTTPNYRLAGVVAELRNSELIAVYGVPSFMTAVENHTVTTYPGMYHTGGGNSFSGTYVVHTNFSARESNTSVRDGNTYANTYYVAETGAAGGIVITPGPNVGTSGTPEIPANVAPFYMLTSGGANRELLEQRSGQTYKYTTLTGVPHANFKDNRVTDSIGALLHYYQTTNSGNITTQYERRLGLSVEYSRVSYTLPNNFFYPMFSVPIGFTLAVNPGLDYGYIAEGSSFTAPGTRVFAPQTELKFIALETPTLPRDDWFYSFTHWQITSGAPIQTWGPAGTKVAMGTGTSPQRYNESILHVVTAGAPMSATANFVQNDNRLRAAINTAISERMIDVLMEGYGTDDAELSEIGEAIQGLLNAGKKDEALYMLIDAMFDREDPESHDFLSIFDFHIMQGSNYAGTTTADYPYSGLDRSGVGLPGFGTVYPNANKTTWGNLVDTEAVAKAIVRDALEAVVKNDTFSTGSHEYDISQIYDPEFKDLIFTDNPNDYRLDPEHASYDPLVRYSISPIREDMLNFIDIGVDLFSGSGRFNQYVASQYAFEQSGALSNLDSNTKPGIKDATGMTITIDTLFKDVGDPLRNPNVPLTNTFGHGSTGGVYISYVDPTGVASAEWDDHWAVRGVKLEKDANDEFTYTINWRDVEANEAGNGGMYIYMREVDENGFEVVTRIPLGISTIASENIRINEGGASQQVGGGASDPEAEPGDDLRVNDLALWWDEIEIMKTNPDTVLTTGKGGSVIPVEDRAAGVEWYKNGRGGGVRPTTLTATPIEGAYAEGIYIEIPASLVEGDTPGDVTAFRAANSPWLGVLGALNDKTTNFFGPVDGVYSIKITADASGNPVSDRLIPAIKLWKEGDGDVPGDYDTDVFPKDVTSAPFPLVSSRQLIVSEVFSDGDFRSGSFTYLPENDIRVVVKYIDLLDEINAAGNNKFPAITGECEVWNVIRHGYNAPNSKFVDIFGIAPAIWTEFLDQIGGAAELNKEYDALSEEVPVAELIKQLTPDNGGYPGTQPVKDLFTFVTALKELNDLMDAKEADIELFSAADKERLKRIRDLADNLLDGIYENGSTIKAVDPTDLNEILEIYYNTLQTYNQILKGSEYDTTTITIITNHPTATSSMVRSWVTNIITDSLTDISTGALFGSTLADGTPPPAPIAMMSMSVLPETYPGGLFTETIIVVKGKFAKFNIPHRPAMTFAAEFMGDPPELGIRQVGTSPSIIDTPGRSTANNIVLTVLYTFYQYEVDVPDSVGNITLPNLVFEVDDITTASGMEITAELGAYTIKIPLADNTGQLAAAGNIDITGPSGLSISVPVGDAVATGLISVEDLGDDKAEITVVGSVMTNIINTTSIKLTTTIAKTFDGELEGDGGLSDEDSAPVIQPTSPIANVTNTATPDPDVDSGESIEHGKTLTITIAPTSGNIVMPGNIVTVQVGATTHSLPVTAGPGGVGIVTVPSALVVGPVTVTDFGDAVKALTPATLQEYLDYLEEKYLDLDVPEDALEYTPPTWNNLIDAVEDAEEFLDPAGDSDKTLLEVYTALITAESRLRKQFKIDLTTLGTLPNLVVQGSAGIIDPAPGAGDAYKIPGAVTPGDDDIDYVTIQPGVVRIDRNYYIADGFNIVLDIENKTTTNADKIVTSATYIDPGRPTPPPRRDALINSDSSIIIQGVRGDISGIDLKLLDKEFNVYLNDGGEGTWDFDETTDGYPIFIVIPPYGEHVTSVTVDGDDPVDLYSEDRPATVDVDVDERGNVTIDDPDLDYTVTFITDIEDPNYGNAIITWKDDDYDNHMVTPGTGPAPDGTPYTTNKYDVSVPAGDATATPAAPTKVEHGDDVVITITPGTRDIDPDGRIRIRIKGVQGEDDIVITGTLSTLEEEAEKLGVEIERDGNVITIKDVTGPVEMDTSYLFTGDREDAIKLAIEELRLALILGEQIKANDEPFTGIYVTTGPEWTDFTRESLEGGGLFSNLTDMTGAQDEEKVRNAKIRKAIELAPDEAALVKVINALLDEEDLSATEILLMIEDAKNELMEAIHNLRLIGSEPDEFKVDTDDIQVSEGIKGGPDLPEITLTEDDGTEIPGGGPIVPGENGITITGIIEEKNPDYTYTGVEITVLDDDGNPHIIFIPRTDKPVPDPNGNTELVEGEDDDPDSYTTTITADELAKAIKDALGIGDEDLEDVTIIAVKVVATKDAEEDEGGIILDLTPADKATDGKGFEDGGNPGDVTINSLGDLVIDNIVTDPGFELTEVVITVTNPLTGDPIIIAAEILVDDSIVDVSDGSTMPSEKITIFEEDLEKLIKDAIDEAVRKEFGDAVAEKLEEDGYTAVITDVTVNSKGGDDVIDVPLTATPGNTGIDKSVEITVSTPGSNDPDDNDAKYDGGIPTGSPHPNPDDIVDIVIDNITLIPGYTTGEVTIEFTDEEGNVLVIVLDLLKDGEDMITVTLDGDPIPGFEITEDILDLLEEIKKEVTSPSPRKEKVTIPGELIKEIVDAVDGFAEDKAPDITKITVDGAREGYVIDLTTGTAPTGGDGVFSPGDVLVRSNKETDDPAKVNTSKDFKISGIEAPFAHSVDRIEVDMILSSGNPAGKLIIIPEYDEYGEVDGFRFLVRDSVGNPYTVPAPILAGIEEVMMESLRGTGLVGEPMSVLFPGGSLDELFAAMPVPAVGFDNVDAFYRRNGLVIRDNDGIEVTGMDKTLDELDAMAAPALLPIVGDLVIDNIRLDEGYALDTVTVTVTVDGDKTYPIVIPIELYMLDEATNGGDQQKVTIPGALLDVLIKAEVDGYSAAMDIKITEIKIGATDEVWIVPPAMVVTENAKHGLVEVKFSYEDEYSFAEVVAGNVGGGGPSLSIPRGRLLNIDIKFEKDDYPRPILPPAEEVFYHTLDSIRIGDVIISADDLRMVGALTDIVGPTLQSGHPLFGLRREKASYTLDIDMLYFLYNAVATDADGPFDLTKMQLVTSPQNTQYQSFIMDYHGTERFPDHEGLLDLEKYAKVGRDDPNFDKRLEYEGMVEKLLDQFTGGVYHATDNPFRLTPDNEHHLKEYEFDLRARMDEIETLREAENVMYEVDEIYDILNFPIKSGDGLDNGDEDPIELNNIEDVIDFINTFDPDNATDAELDVMKQITELIDELFTRIEDVLDDYDDLSEDGKGVIKDEPFPRGSDGPKPDYKDALDDLRDLLVAIEESLLDDAGYFNLLVDRIGDVPDFVPESQLSRDEYDDEERDWIKHPTLPLINTPYDGTGDTIAERIVQLEKVRQQIEKAEEAWKALNPADRTKAIRARGILDGIVADFEQEEKDLAELLKEFVDDFLTWRDEDEYVTRGIAAPDNYSADSLTGLKLPRPANRPLTAEEEADLRRGIAAYFELPLTLQDEIDKIFHHPTVRELAILFRDYDPVRPIDPVTVAENVKDELEELKKKLVDDHKNGDDAFEDRMDEILKDAWEKIDEIKDRFESDDIVFKLTDDDALSEEDNKIVITFTDDAGQEVVITITIEEDGKITGITVEIDGVETKDDFDPDDYTDLVNVSDDGKTITVTSDKVKDLIDDHNSDPGTDPKIIIRDYPVRLIGELFDDEDNSLAEDNGRIGDGDIGEALKDINDIREEYRFKLQKEAAVKAIWNEYFAIVDAINDFDGWDDKKKADEIKKLGDIRDLGLGNEGTGNANRGKPIGVNEDDATLADFGEGMTFPSFKEADVLAEWARTVALMRAVFVRPTMTISPPVTIPVIKDEDVEAIVEFGDGYIIVKDTNPAYIYMIVGPQPDGRIVYIERGTGDDIKFGPVIPGASYDVLVYRYPGPQVAVGDPRPGVNPAGEVSITVPSGGGGGGIGVGGGTGADTGDEGVLRVIVDGVAHDVGYLTDEDGVRTITFDQDALHAEIEDGVDHVRVIVPYNRAIGTYEIVFVVLNVEEMAEKAMDLIIEIGPLTYKMPSKAVDTEAIMTALGATDPAEVPFKITIVKTVDDETRNTVNNTLASFGKQQMHMPLQFHITASYDGETVVVDKFLEFVSRTIEVTADVARRITTGVIICELGTSRHVPTDVFRANGRYYAKINSLTNSTYVLIYYDKTFDDILETWYAACVDEKASRTIVKGREDGLFYSKDEITRAEFAAIIVRAYGLAPSGNGRMYTDVPVSAWYTGYVSTAYEYGLMQGIGGGLFDPNRNITREEAMLIIQRAAAVAKYDGQTGDISHFPDARDVSSWALGAARWNVGSELIVGKGGILDPKANITRSETSTLVLRLLRNAELIDVREFSQPDLYRS